MADEDLAVRIPPLVLVAGRLFGTLLLSYLFIAILMTASAQGRVAERLSKLGPPVDYSTGYATWRGAGELEKEAKARRADYDAAVAAAEKKQAEVDNESDEYSKVIAPLRTLRRRLSALQCEINQEPNPNVDQVPQILTEMRGCLDEMDTVPANLRRETERLLENPTELEAVVRKHAILSREAVRLEGLATKAKQIADDRQGLVAKQGVVHDSFSELNVLGGSWLLAGGLFVEFPPSMIQIVLAFISGLFGGLLITLVLVVYPQSELTMASQSGGFGARILLGGLISLCVYIVLGGGTAVLGASNAFADGEANYLAFCAVGILAGMFSDRVAHWLSTRADAFFERDPARNGGASENQSGSGSSSS